MLLFFQFPLELTSEEGVCMKIGLLEINLDCLIINILLLALYKGITIKISDFHFESPDY